jgi:hypothetical protein
MKNMSFGIFHGRRGLYTSKNIQGKGVEVSCVGNVVED